jgi:ubiquinone/menaquinone biosynthesis C-methylase UbiE
MVEREILERFSGFSKLYDRYRPKPPRTLTNLVLCLLKKDKVKRVIDLGCGTGLSTFIWSAVADHVIGIEPNDELRQIAEQKAEREGCTNVSFECGDSYKTKEKKSSVDIVTCSQSFHWMEPVSTLKEVNRILKCGGVFITCDCDWPPTVAFEAENAFLSLISGAKEILKRRPGGKRGVKRWDKSKHLENMQKSGYFKCAKEILLHHRENGNAERFINLALSQGNIQDLLKRGIPPEKFRLTRFMRDVNRSIGDQKVPIYFSYRVRIGMK